MVEREIKLDIGCGRRKDDGWIGIDKVQIIVGGKPVADKSGRPIIDHVVDLEREAIPYPDSSVAEIKADSFIEHIDNLEHLLNECWRVLTPGGVFFGVTPICGTRSHWKDPTHRRCFVRDTFNYFVGKSNWHEDAPSYPRWASYGFKRWILLEYREEGDIIHFKMTPDKQ